MSRASADPQPIPIRAFSAHLRVQRGAQSDVAIAARAVENLASVYAIALRVSASKTVDSNRGVQPPVAIGGMGGLALLASATGTSSYRPPNVSEAAAQLLAQPPELTFASGDLVQLESRINDLASTWKDRHWSDRIAVASPHMDDITRLGTLKHEPREVQQLAQGLATASRRLAHAALSDTVRLRVALEHPDHPERPHLAIIPTMSHRAIAQSALSRFGISCLRPSQDQRGHVYVTARCFAQLIACTDVQRSLDDAKSTGRTRVTVVPIEDVLRSTDAATVLPYLFVHLRDPRVSHTAAALMQCSAEQLHHHIADLRAVATGRRFHLVSER